MMRWPALLATTLVACTGGSSNPDPTTSSSSTSSGGTTSGGTTSGGSTSSGSSGEEAPRSQVVATIKLTGASCPATGLPNVGAFGPPATPVQNEGEWEGKAVAVECKTTAAGANIIVVGSASYGVESGIEIDGAVATSGTQQIGIAVTADGKTYNSGAPCALEYPTNGGVAMGRFWGKVSCADTVNAQGTSTGCALEAEVRLENCAQ